MYESIFPQRIVRDRHEERAQKIMSLLKKDCRAYNNYNNKNFRKIFLKSGCLVVDSATSVCPKLIKKRIFFYFCYEKIGDSHL